MRSYFPILWIFVLVNGLPILCQADLHAYFRRPEPVYRWESRGDEKFDNGRLYNLHLVSQEWQGIVWEHALQLFVPDGVDHPRFCALLNTGGNPNTANAAIALNLAKKAGCVFAVLYNIPNQPLFDGKTEDELIVHTWLKFLETGDENWPLHFPMAKAVLKAMDAIQAFAKQKGLVPIEGFLITGASKRGWTTWLAGASRDPRIKAIAPMVIDVLNLPAQVRHQLASYGKPSEQIEDYTRAGLLEKLSTPEAKRLIELEDPYSYRDILTLPKLIILGTNDRYWTQDALNLYWDGLKGPKWVLYTPNSGHGLEDRERVFNTLAAFIRKTATGGQWPQMKWTFTDTAEGVQLTLSSDIAPQSARLFHVSAPTKDFRDGKWTSIPMTENGGSFMGQMPAPKEGYTAIFGEATYNLDGKPFTLSTQIRIIGPANSK